MWCRGHGQRAAWCCGRGGCHRCHVMPQLHAAARGAMMWRMQLGAQ
jgi:hypothetical protein